MWHFNMITAGITRVILDTSNNAIIISKAILKIPIQQNISTNNTTAQTINKPLATASFVSDSFFFNPFFSPEN